MWKFLIKICVKIKDLNNNIFMIAKIMISTVAWTLDSGFTKIIPEK